MYKWRITNNKSDIYHESALFYNKLFINSINLQLDNIFDIISDDSIFALTSTVVTVSNIDSYNLHTTSIGDFIKLSFDSVTSLSYINYINSTTKFVEALSSQLQITNLMSTNISLTQYLIDYTDCMNVTLKNILIHDISSTSSFLKYATRSSIDQILNMTIFKIDVAVLKILRSNVTSIDNLHIFDITDGIHLQESSIELLKNSRIYRSGSTSILRGGALLIKNSNSTMQNMTFEYNVAQSGGAVYIDCDSYNIC